MGRGEYLGLAEFEATEILRDSVSCPCISSTSVVYVPGCFSSFFLGALDVANSVRGRWVCLMAGAARAQSAA